MPYQIFWRNIKSLILLLFFLTSCISMITLRLRLNVLIFYFIILFTMLMLFYANNILDFLYKLCIDKNEIGTRHQTKKRLMMWLVCSVSILVLFASNRSVWHAGHVDPGTVFFLTLLPSAWLLPFTDNAYVLSGILILPVIASLLPAEEAYAATIERYAILVYYFFITGVIKNLVQIFKKINTRSSLIE